ncbi:MAG: HAD family phosphatase, partial [Clostridia bacterium]|nr:HAD family phosphatase [Clostridia bacterium]
MSIKNVVFDFGQVLVYFQPSYMVGAYVSDEADKALIEEVVFDRLYWDRLDSGDISDEEVVST